MIIAFQTLIYFRESLLTALDWLIPIWPYYKKWTLTKKGADSEDGEEEHVFADYDDEKGVVFYPPVYAQRYAAVADCLMDERWAGKIQKVVDFGYNDMSFIKYLKDVPGIRCILGVDIETLPLRCSSDLLGFDDYAPRRETSPLQITLYQGNAADPDYRLIGCDAVVAIEMIEHMLPQDLERLVHTVFGFIKPQIAVFTTPNGDFNVLFKALEKNRLRRLDHFFEWTREQFHDWCSNIVARYPDYTVTCKGIGPGPAGTQRYGCCSQLAMFICKDYHKQQDLDINCLALVANAPKHNDFDEMTDSWESPDPITEVNMLCAPDITESYGELLFSEKYSSSCILDFPESVTNLVYKDEGSQCNLDAERGKNFLMFDDEVLCFNVLTPQRKIDTKVYEFEDVACRLNCSHFQVKKFSKTSQNLMARNKLDSLVHTREIVDEIRHMTKMLNFNKNIMNQCSVKESTIWNNINWGENAPYWNQYYKIIKEFSYPFEVKSEECRILDLIYDEINRLIDTHDTQFSVDANKLEIPLEHLMQVVEHLTNDMSKVKDLLEWNGYEIVENVVIYSRLVVENTSVGSLDDEWQDNDPLSDWDTSDVQSLSDASTMPDIYGRSLRRALDLKVKKLRSLLTADEDITTELDKIVCRLMKLALRTSEDHQMPPPATWMQRKLLDLLSLTEKAIERRRKHSIESYPLKAIEYDHYYNVNNTVREGLKLSTFQNDDTADRIFDKYLMLSSEPSDNIVVKSEVNYTEENFSVASNDKDPFTIERKSLYEEVRLESIKSESKEEIRLEITQGWIDEDYDGATLINDFVVKSDVASSDSNTSNDSQYIYDNDRNKFNDIRGEKEYEAELHVTSKNKINKFAKSTTKRRKSKNKSLKKVSKKHSSSVQLAKSYSKKFEYVEYKSYTLNKPKKSFTEYLNLQPTLSKPIPRSLIELCYQDLTTEKNEKLIESSLCIHNNNSDNLAATKESLFIDIVAEDLEESYALRRSIATDADCKSDIMESEAILETVINVTKDDSFVCNNIVPFETVDSETIFLYDLNEPSTSKGIRHVSADAQCGTDMVCSISPAVNSLINLPSKFGAGIKISDSFTKLEFDKKYVDFGTVTDEINFYRGLSVYTNNSLKIKDSNEVTIKTVECSTMTHDNDIKLEKTITKPIPNVINTIESHSELQVCCSNLSRSGLRCLKNPSDSGMSQRISVTKYIKPKLSCCGIHLHSYRDRQVSEDVLFLGEWQKKGPTVLARKIPCALNCRKRENIIKKREVKSKEKIVCPLKPKNTNRVSEKVSNRPQNLKYASSKRDNKTKDNIKTPLVPNNTSKNVRNVHISKVASKIVASVTTSRSAKSISTKKKMSDAKCNNNFNYRKQQHILVNKKEETPNTKPNTTVCKSRTLNKTVNNPKQLKKIDLPVNKLKTKTDEIKDNLLKFSNQKRKNITYLVFRNEIENCRSANTSSANSKSLTKVEGSNNNYSSTSQNSSPCSSPNSIATVRALSPKSKSYCHARNSTSPEKNNTENVIAISSSDCKIKRYIKSTKGTKMLNQSSSTCGNKENLPQTSKKLGTLKKVEKSSKSLISDRNTNVFILQVKAESPTSIARKNSDCSAKSISSSNTNNILKNKNADNHHRELSPSSFNKCLINKNKSLNDTSYKKDDICTNDTPCNKNETCKFTEINTLTRSSTPIIDKLDSFKDNELSNDKEQVTKSNIKRSNSKINAAMKQLIEERLSFIKRMQDKNDSDSETIVLSRDDMDNNVNERLSPISYKTVVTNENTCNVSGPDIENALLNCSLESDLESLATLELNYSRVPSVETDFLSFRSTESKCSQYLTENNELDKTLTPEQSSNIKTVRDLFERKDQPASKNVGGTLAVQVFSGFSMDGEAAVGDQPEYTRLVDPETGNLTLEIARQATSEELFVSGRSSDTYESCYVEDDAFLPNWLFHIISHQQSAEIPDEEQEPEPADQIAEPDYDANGNVMDASFGAGVGAGDGHGMHSDQSQDSSGRATSISSSDVSSGPQSEAILIDPSTFLAPGVRAGTLVTSAVVPVESSDTSFRIDRGNDNETTQRRINRAALVSDGDADVSSLETDAADSDN